MTKTTFAGRNPFKPKAPLRFVDPDDLAIANDPLPTSRAQPEHKYNEKFSKLKPGQCLVCEGEDAAKIAHALGLWLKRHNKDGVVRSTKAYEGAAPGSKAGRVWLIAEEKRLKVAA